MDKIACRKCGSYYAKRDGVWRVCLDCGAQVTHLSKGQPTEDDDKDPNAWQKEYFCEVVEAWASGNPPMHDGMDPDLKNEFLGKCPPKLSEIAKAIREGGPGPESEDDWRWKMHKEYHIKFARTYGSMTAKIILPRIKDIFAQKQGDRMLKDLEEGA